MSIAGLLDKLTKSISYHGWVGKYHVSASSSTQCEIETIDILVIDELLFERGGAFESTPESLRLSSAQLTTISSQVHRDMSVT